MNAHSIVRAFARNNAWSNYRLHEACARLSHGELHAARTSFFFNTPASGMATSAMTATGIAFVGKNSVDQI